MKKFLVASILAMTTVCGANAGSISLNDAYLGMELGMGFISYEDISGEALKYVPNSAFLLGFDLGAKFLPLESTWNPGISLNYNLSFPTEPEKSITKQKPSYTFWTIGADFDNYFALGNNAKPEDRTDFVFGLGIHSITTSVSGGGANGSDSSMALAFKLGIDQGISEDLKFVARLHYFIPTEEGVSSFTKLSIGFKKVF